MENKITKTFSGPCTSVETSLLRLCEYLRGYVHTTVDHDLLLKEFSNVDIFDAVEADLLKLFVESRPGWLVYGINFRKIC